MNEIWKDVEGYERLYQVSNLGNVKSLPRNTTKGGILKPLPFSSGNYIGYRVELSNEGKRRKHLISRLVAIAFIPNPDDKPCVNHIDADPSNNHSSNLEWCTVSENTKHAADLGLLHDNSIAVIQYDLQGNIIAEYASAKKAEKMTTCKRPDISQCCKGKLKTSKGFIWKYANEPLTKKELVERTTKKSYPKNRKSRIK